MSEIPPDKYRVSADGFLDMMGELQMDWRPHIHSDPETLLGKPVVKGTRLAVDFILRLLATGWTEQLTGAILQRPSMHDSAVRRIYRYLVQSKCEGLRTYEAVICLLHRISGANSLLDVGCGDGIKTMHYARELGVDEGKVYGIEQQYHYVEIASKYIKLMQIDLERDLFPLGDEEVDVIICNQVLEHLKNIFTPMKEMARVVKTGGYLLIGIPNLAAIQNRILLLFGRQPMCNALNSARRGLPALAGRGSRALSDLEVRY